jgi:uncharacterized protein YfiM (DUF2279 family)
MSQNIPAEPRHAIFRRLSVAVAFIAVFVATDSIANPEEDSWEGRDKSFHLISGIVIGASVTAYTKSPTKGVLAGVAIGVLKEVSDKESESHTASFKDATVTALGAIAGSYVTGLIIVPGAVWYRWTW